jgi:hypothetical protein
MYEKSWVDSRTLSIPFVFIATNFSKEPPNKQSAEKKKMYATYTQFNDRHWCPEKPFHIFNLQETDSLSKMDFAI